MKGILEGMTASDAYRGAYDTKDMLEETIWAEASRTRSNHKVSAWLDKAREQALTSAIMSKEAYIQELYNDRVKLATDHPALSLKALE